jgi:CubicO group peptidase (beta-lactamase class C family)
MVVALADVQGRRASISIGWDNQEMRMPMRSDRLFQIGSISKSLTALCLHSLAGSGIVRLDADVREYLPEVPWPDPRITLGNLLNHTSGLPRDAEPFPDVPGQRLWNDFPPGSRSRYSNLGYKLIGMLIARVTGQPFHDTLRERVLIPLGMTTALPLIAVRDRRKYAVSYLPAYEDQQLLSRDPLVPAELDGFVAASGCVAAAASDMGRYLSYVLRLGRGQGQPILTDRQAVQLLADDTASDEFVPDGRYASGFGKVRIGGTDMLHHTGGMQSFVSSFHADPKSGFGCMASVNGRLTNYRPKKVTAYAIQLINDFAGRRPPTPTPVPLEARRVNSAGLLNKNYRSVRGIAFQFLSDGGQVKLLSDGKTARVEQKRKGVLVTDHERFREYAFEFVGDDYKSVWWGNELFVSGPVLSSNNPNPDMMPFAGTYSSGRPQDTERFFVRQQALVLEGTGAIVRSAEGYWHPEDESGERDRIWFGGFIGKAPSYMNLNGKTLYRTA